jgi:hypothetical protein
VPGAEFLIGARVAHGAAAALLMIKADIAGLG